MLHLMYLYGTSSLLRFVTHYVELGVSDNNVWTDILTKKQDFYGIAIQIVNN
ncbi:hypothetical protein [uncultured Photobacterium sp.]|uniref:hypothetical protein n=1 Tax=uncultured Photobacterium sp. TaxID=173973 RepID=UPI002628356C|nr:hypothetical protein [uncultured Photobacterium sp.]